LTYTSFVYQNVFDSSDRHELQLVCGLEPAYLAVDINLVAVMHTNRQTDTTEITHKASSRVINN